MSGQSTVERSAAADLAVCAAATPGPWRKIEKWTGRHDIFPPDLPDGEHGQRFPGPVAVYVTDEDCAFLVLARDALPHWIAEAQRLREAIRKFLAASGHDLCHENRQVLAHAAGLDCGEYPSLPEEAEFARRCDEYRQKLYGPDPPSDDVPAGAGEFCI